MPFVRIAPDKVQHLGLFGYDYIQKGANGYDWYHGPKGRTAIDPASPVVWVEDVTDAIQLGAVAIKIAGDPEED